MRIYKTSDRIPVIIDDLEFKVSPLTYEQKMQISSCVTTVSGQEIFDAAKAAQMAIKFAVKDVKGLETENGDYELKLENGILTDECVDDIANLPMSDKLTVTLLNLLQGVPKEVVNPSTGQKIEGVIFNKPKGKVKAKK